jgi:hypothetical protein
MALKRFGKAALDPETIFRIEDSTDAQRKLVTVYFRDNRGIANLTDQDAEAVAAFVASLPDGAAAEAGPGPKQ